MRLFYQWFFFFFLAKRKRCQEFRQKCQSLVMIFKLNGNEKYESGGDLICKYGPRKRYLEQGEELVRLEEREKK